MTSIFKDVSNFLRLARRWRRSADALIDQLMYIAYAPPQVWLGSRVVSVLDSGAEGPGFKSQPRRCRVTVLGERFTPIVPLFTEQRNW